MKLFPVPEKEIKSTLRSISMSGAFSFCNEDALLMWKCEKFFDLKCCLLIENAVVVEFCVLNSALHRFAGSHSELNSLQIFAVFTSMN
jgi:hypothetical protein